MMIMKNLPLTERVRLEGELLRQMAVVLAAIDADGYGDLAIEAQAGTTIEWEDNGLRLGDIYLTANGESFQPFMEIPKEIGGLATLQKMTGKNNDEIMPLFSHTYNSVHEVFEIWLG